jgi:hypothetical protein
LLLLAFKRFAAKKEYKKTKDPKQQTNPQMRKDSVMNTKVGFALIVLLAVAAILGASLSSPSRSMALSETAVEGSKFDVSSSLADNLKSYMGKNVYVHLKSGSTLQGYVKEVGKDLVHLQKLAGKDFYDALISIEEITAMEARFREMK